MILRKIETRDIQECARLYAEVFSGPPWNESWSEALALDRLMHFHDSRGFVGLLAEQENIVGFALGNTEPFQSHKIFYLREMCTAPEKQFLGIGRQVIGALENELSLLNVTGIFLTTKREIPAARFYISNGFSDNTSMGFYAKKVGS